MSGKKGSTKSGQQLVHVTPKENRLLPTIHRSWNERMVKSSYLEELDVSLNVFIVKFALFNELELFEDFALDHGDAVLFDHLCFFHFLDQVLQPM